MEYQPLFTASFLKSLWAVEFAEYQQSGADEALQQTLKMWAEKDFQKETTAQGTFVDVFFKGIWGYTASGQTQAGEGHTCEAEYPIERAGQTGGTGSADLALGWFNQDRWSTIPQAFCEFKDVRSGLDIPQNRKGNTRSPVKQCADYLRYAAADLYGNEPVQPSWAIVTDMNEFRLYSQRSIPHRFQRFVVRATDALDKDDALLGPGDGPLFRRFIFSKLFQPAMLLGTTGPSALDELLRGQWIHEKEIENQFYTRYQEYRQFVYESLVEANPDFEGSRGKLVRLTQRFLDRCIFVLFCEDMGSALDFPRNLVRDLLSEMSRSSFVNREDNSAWQRLKALFAAMRDGTQFGPTHINRFNGGLFAHDPELENLHIPTKVFLEPGQGASVESLSAHPRTLLYLSAVYNFGAAGPGNERAIDLYALGRIFEQSITELEAMEAKADGRLSLTEISKRKRDGVYYTPEWVIHYIVEETLGARLSELRHLTGIEAIGPVTDEEALEYITHKDLRFTKYKRINDYITALDTYRDHLNELTVVDPACGSGAFLIGALQRLFAERRWLIEERSRVSGQLEVFDQDAVTKSILSKNIYGVDINAESVEITRLALWLHTATPGHPLSTLDDNILCGNSLVGPDFYDHHQSNLFDEEHRERINVFDWQTAFPQVFARGGFDCVIGNPPYVKLQHFRQIEAPVAEYLKDARRPNGRPVYQSTQTGNFDLYLPFIERGIELLKPEGRLGFIAPSVWLKNDYGQGLRTLIHHQKSLERWLDFKSFQVFDEATTYTSLQFFRATPQPGIQLIEAPTGDLKGLHWDKNQYIDYAALDPREPWNLQPPAAFALLNRLAQEFPTLEQMSERICVGIQTSADHIYHLTKVRAGKYISHVDKSAPIEVEIEDELMRPLVSGPEAKRYQLPKTETYLLFPYDISQTKPRLWSASEMQENFPRGWAYLQTQEQALRARERGKMNLDNGWWAYNYPKNLDKQEFPKLIVAQTVPEMRVCADFDGVFFLNNVRVNGILADNALNLGFMLGVLNSKLVDFVFRRIAKPKDGGYFEANKQFIAPLPIPDASPETRQKLGDMARELQEKHTQRRDLIEQITRALNSSQILTQTMKEDWIWADYRDWRAWRKSAPDTLANREKNAWARQRAEADLKERLAPITERLLPNTHMSAHANGPELTFTLNQHPVIDGIYVPETDAEFIAAQWRHLGRTTNITPTFTAERLLRELLKLRSTPNQALKDTVLKYDTELHELEAQIHTLETTLNNHIYALYNLTPIERQLVEADFATA